MQNETIMNELSLEQLDTVGGGGMSAGWAVATGVAAAFTTAAGATLAVPIIAGAFAAAGILAAAAAIGYGLSDDENISAT